MTIVAEGLHEHGLLHQWTVDIHADTDPGDARHIVPADDQSPGIKDLAGNSPTANQSLSFVIAGSPFVSSIVAPAPSTAAVQSINITFSDPTQARRRPSRSPPSRLYQNVDWAAYTGASANPQPWPITGTPVTLDPDVTIAAHQGDTTGTKYHLSGLKNYTSAAGNYVVTVDSSNVKSATGTAFAGTLSYFFSVLPGNGVVGVATVFDQTPTTTSPHHVLITAIPQDPGNDGFVNTQDVSFQGQVWRPGEASFLPPPDGSGSHLHFVIDAYEKTRTG